MKKILKFIAYAVGAVLLLAILLVLTLPLWLGPVVKPSVNAVVPKMTGTEFNLGHLYLNPYTGRFELGKFMLGNPKGYDEPVAVSLSNLVVDVGMTTVGSEYVHIEEVTVEGVFVSYLDGGENDVNNFEQIQYNLAGGKEKYEEAKKKSELEKAKAEAEEEVREEAEETVEDVSETKVVIDRLAIRDIKVRLGPITLPVPADIELTDLGKKSNGITVAELFEQIWQSILKSTGAVGDGLKALGSMLSEQSGKLGEQVSKAGEAASKAAATATESVSKATEAVGDTAGKATKAVGDTTKNAAEAIGDTTKKATEAVGEGAKKATDAVKNLLKF